MAVATTSTFGSFSSAVRLGFLDVEPIEEKRIVKQWGVKFQRVERRYEPKIESITEYTEMLAESLLESITIPSRFKREELESTLIKKFMQSLESEQDLEEELEDFLASREKQSGFERTYRFIVFLRDRHHRNLERYIRSEAAMLFNSNLPFTLLNHFVTLDRSYGIYLSLMVDRIRYHTRKLQIRGIQSDLVKTKRYLRKARGELSPWIDLFDSVNFAALRIKVYIDLCNSSNYEDILESKFLSFDKVDKHQYEQMVKDFIFRLRVFRSKLISERPEIFAQRAKERSATLHMIQGVTDSIAVD